jgi:hypothetical protein
MRLFFVNEGVQRIENTKTKEGNTVRHLGETDTSGLSYLYSKDRQSSGQEPREAETCRVHLFLPVYTNTKKHRSNHFLFCFEVGLTRKKYSDFPSGWWIINNIVVRKLKFD